MLSMPHWIGDRTEFLLNSSAVNPGEAIARVIRLLAAQGAEVIGIPCNTAHASEIFDTIERRSPAACEVVHMVGEVCEFLKHKHPGATRVGVLGTTGLLESRVYARCLDRYDYQAVEVPRDVQDACVHPGIYDPEYGIKSTAGVVTPRAISELRTGLSSLVRQGAEAIVLGCTEIPLAIREDVLGSVPLIDATRVLARALILRSSPEDLIEAAQ